MNAILTQFRMLEPTKELVLQGDLSFIGLLRILRRKTICFQSGCTTCGCRAYRIFLRELGDDGIAKMMNRVTRAELLAEGTLDWHDAMEVLLVDNSPTQFYDSYIYRAYILVWNEYRKLWREDHLKPRAARVTVLDMLPSLLP